MEKRRSTRAARVVKPSKKPRRKTFWLRMVLAALLFFGTVYIRDAVPAAKEPLERLLRYSVDTEKIISIIK